MEADLKVKASKQTTVSLLCDPVISHVKGICKNPEDMIEVEIHMEALKPEKRCE